MQFHSLAPSLRLCYSEFGELFGVLIALPPIKAQKAHSAAIGLGFFAIRQGRDCPLP